MPQPVNILCLLPSIAAIGRAKLQDYCCEWLQRPIAKNYGVAHLIVGADLMLTVNLAKADPEVAAGYAVVPICELLDFIIDQHFQSAAERNELHSQAREIRRQWSEIGYQYEAMAGRVGRLWIKCKNPNCDASLETAQEAVEGQQINCPPCQLTCPACGHVDLYDGNDLFLRFADQ